MIITDSNIKFMYDNNLYTLLQKDENSIIHVKYNNKFINLATNDEAINNLTDYSYNKSNPIKIYCNINNTLVQLAVKENFEINKVYTLTFEEDNTLLNHTSDLVIDNNFVKLKELNVKNETQYILFNDSNEEIELTDCISNNTYSSLRVKETSICKDTIDLTKDSVSLINLIQNETKGILLDSIDVTQTIKTVTYEDNLLDMNNTELINVGYRIIPIRITQTIGNLMFNSTVNDINYTQNNISSTELLTTLSTI